MDSSSQALKKEEYQPFTSPQFKSLKCFTGKRVLINSNAQQSIDRLPSGIKKELNNKMSCIATTNISTVGKPKLYIETMSGLLEFVLSRKANRTETMIEQVRYLKGLRQPWTGKYIQLSRHQAKKAGRNTLNIYYTHPIYSYPEEPLKDFLLRVAPTMRRLTDSKFDEGKIRVPAGSEFASAIFVFTGSVKQYALILETQGLPHLSVATRKAPLGFRTKKNNSKRETVHTHGEMSWSNKVGRATLALIEVYGGSERNKDALKKEFFEPYDNDKGVGKRVRGDENHFSKRDYANPGWLVTENACLKYQKGSNTDVDMGCPQ